MNTDSLIKILSIFNKPFHYFIAGIIILIFGDNSWRIWGWLLIGLSFASLIEWILNLIKEEFNKRQKKTREQKEEIAEKENLYNAYDNLNRSEKIIIFTCVHENKIVCTDSWRQQEEEFLALQTKGFGKRDGFEKFVMKPKYLKLLSEYKQVEIDYKEYCAEEEKYMEEYGNI